MKRHALAVLALAAAVPVSAAYTYYYTDSLTTSLPSNWNQNGSVQFGSSGFSTPSASSGALISKVAVPDGTSEYEVKATLTNPNSFNGEFDFYFDATPNALNSPSTGNFYVVDYAPQSGGYIGVRWVNAGASTTVGSGSFPPHNGMVFRVVRRADGQIIVYVDNNIVLWAKDTTISSGQPGIGMISYATGAAAYISQVQLGPCDRIAPNTPAVPSVSAFSSHVDFSWPAVADDVNGTGVGLYQFLRNYSFATNVSALSPLTWSDTTVTPGNIYTYTFIAYDMHFNPSYVSFTVTVPVSPGSPPYAPDGHRIGVRTTGAYWGSGGENIDVLSGNVNFTAPLITAKARGSMSIPINLNYNSQNWRKNPDTSVTKLGYDIGYGYGWRIMAGSMVWFADGYYGISYWKFTDATGAEYKLTDYNSGSGVWQSRDSAYVWYNPSTNQLYFRDGTVWTFGCQSSSSEPDAGTLYPTQIEDTNGNQILIRYMTGAGAGGTNTSGRIWQVEDVRALLNGHSSFTFSYDSAPKLTSIADNVGSGQSYTFSYYSGTLVAPWGSGTYGTVDYISQVSGGVGTFQFTYDGSGYTGELGDVAYPYGGHTTYNYQDVTYGNGYAYRQVYQRSLKPDGVTNLLYTINHETTPGNSTHQYTTIDDAGGVGEKYWAFSQTGVNIGMVTQYQGRSSGVAKTQDDLTWAQDTGGDLYIGSTVHTLDPGQTYAAAKRTDQEVDYFGNLTQVLEYAYGNLTAPARIYQYTYLNATPYQVAHIFNRVATVTATGSFVPGQPYQVVNLASNTYDAGSTTTTTGTPQEWDASYSPSYTARGNVTSSSTLTGGATYAYDQTGTVTSTTANGVTASVSSTSATNFAAPSQVTVGSLSNSMAYDVTSILAPDSVTGPNGASAAWGWDSLGRPSSTTSPFGAVTNTSYVLSGGLPGSPGYTTVTVNGRWTKTTFDGFARPTLVETGNGSTTVSQAETQYAPCGCTPQGKMYRTAVPHAPGGTPAYTTYTYDGIGRTLSVQAADGASTTTYSYQGNVVTVTDPAGKWKAYTTDAFGHLTQVSEPNPAGGGGGGNGATFVKIDTATQGSWKGVYGSDGYTVLDDTTSYPAYATVTPSPYSNYVWSYSTSDVRALQKAASPTDRLAALWFTYTTYTIDLNFTDGLAHQMAVYNLDWDYGGRSQNLSILDGTTGAVLDSRNLSGFQNGQYVVWTLKGHVVLEVNYIGGPTTSISGLFFDPVAGGGGGGNYLTTYTYDLLDHLIGVSMPRATGTQTRTFNYAPPGSPPGAFLLSATNPENGTVSYTYNTGGNQKIATKTDAKGQQTQYSYDSYARLIEVRHYISGSEDTCQRVDFYYDSNPFNGSYSLNASGRLAAVQYQNATINPGFCGTTFQEWYSYNAGGARVGKEMQVIRGGVSLPHALISSYMYDTEGRMTSQQYPDSYTYDYMGNPTVLVTGATLTYTYDTMGRLSGLTENGTNNIISSSSTTYGPAGELTAMSGTWGSESRSYNAMKQMTYLSSGSLSIGYNYSSTQNNGKITSQQDYVSGETVTYAYDTLNRLATAGTSAWGQSYAYDGFGNLTDITSTLGTTPEWHVAYSASTNRASNDCADGNGNIEIIGTGCSALSAYSYDVENRIIFSGVGTVPAVEYAYAPDNKRVWRGVFSSGSRTTDEVTFWSVTGQRVGIYDLVSYSGSLWAVTAPANPGTGTEYYFGGRLLKNVSGYVHADRLGSIGKYYPYGQERPSATANGTEKFATYFRDSDTGLDYADQRYHAPGQGRFLSPDLYPASAGASSPGTWNRYGYGGGDPVNNVDPSGQDFCDIDAYLDGGAPLSCSAGLDVADVCAALLPNFEAVQDCEQTAVAEANALAQWCQGIVQAYTNGAPWNPACGQAPEIIQQHNPTCSLTLEYRPAGITGVLGATHSSIVVSDSFGFTFTIQGQPQNYPFPPWGNLVVGNTPGDIHNQQWGGLTSTVDPNLCSQVSEIEGGEVYYSNHPVAYNPRGPNSNSLVHWLLLQAPGLYFTAPPGTYGWNTPLYGN